jgi:amidase
MGGSLRNPASFCGVVGLRPSPGRVPYGRAPDGPVLDPFDPIIVLGPMARNVGDLGLFLDAMAGPDRRDPRAQPENSGFRAAAEAPRLPRRVAFSRDLGITPVDPQIAAICETAARRFEALGAVVEEAQPDLTGAHEAFQTLRAVAFVTDHTDEYENQRDKLKPDVVWNIEQGFALTGEQVARANRIRARLVANLAAFFDTYDLLLSPATIVPPYPVENRTVTECAGVTFETYIDWLAIAFAVTLTSAPALSLPCGFTADGLPVGLQMVGPLRSEGTLLSFAAALEAELALDLGPIDPREGS